MAGLRWESRSEYRLIPLARNPFLSRFVGQQNCRINFINRSGSKGLYSTPEAQEYSIHGVITPTGILASTGQSCA